MSVPKRNDILNPANLPSAPSQAQVDDPILTWEEKKRYWPEFPPLADPALLLREGAELLNTPGAYTSEKRRLDALQALSTFAGDYPESARRAIAALEKEAAADTSLSAEERKTAYTGPINSLREELGGAALNKGVAPADLKESGPLTRAALDSYWSKIDRQDLQASDVILSAASLLASGKVADQKSGVETGLKNLVQAYPQGTRVAQDYLEFMGHRAAKAGDADTAEFITHTGEFIQAAGGAPLNLSFKPDPDPKLSYAEKKALWSGYAPAPTISQSLLLGAGYLVNPEAEAYDTQEERDKAAAGFQKLVAAFPGPANEALKLIEAGNSGTSPELAAKAKALISQSLSEAAKNPSGFPVLINGDRAFTPGETDTYWQPIDAKNYVSNVIVQAGTATLVNTDNARIKDAALGLKNLVRSYEPAAHIAVTHLGMWADESNANGSPNTAKFYGEIAVRVQSEIDAFEREKKISAAIGGLQGVRVAEHVAPTATGDMASPQRPVVTPTTSTQRAV